MTEKISAEGQFTGKHEMVLESVPQTQAKHRLCFLFPGQGSELSGRFRNEFSKYPEFKRIFEVADDFAAKNSMSKISDFLLNHSALSYNESQRIKGLCLIATELAFFGVLQSRDIKPSIVTGHSIGEFASLVASGILSFPDILEFIHYRDSLTPERNSLGYMISVNSPVKTLESSLSGLEFFVSCINSPSHTVISCSKEALVEIEARLKEKGIVSRTMDISQPFHSPLMEGVREKLKEYLESANFTITRPSIPMYSFILQEAIDSGSFSEQKIRKILADSVTSPVDFVSQAKNLVSLGFYNFVEVGPGDSLTFFMKSAAHDSAVTSSPISQVLNLRGNAQAAGDFSELEKSRAFDLVSNVVSRITGYKIERITLEDRFQEDLGIDSIKQANIAFTIMEGLNIPQEQVFEFYDFETIKDVVAFLHNSGALDRIDPEKMRKIINDISNTNTAQ